MTSTFIACAALSVAIQQAPAADSIYLSDESHRILFSQQGWGELGINRCAHARGTPPTALQIGDKTYVRGLGHHAPGEMIVELGGEFATFEAEVGLQNLATGPGSVAFKVYVDDQEKFDSGVMKSSDKAKHVSIPVEGAMEMRLVETDAGDGLACDCANWAEARLIRSQNPRRPAKGTVLDVAPFAEVVTSDPARVSGARSSRIQEYPAEDVFLETPLARGEKGGYAITDYDGTGCIGLRWLERRMVRELGVDFDGSAPPKFGVQVQAWVGESLWQGKWVNLGGKLTAQDKGFRLVIDWSRAPEARSGTRKIRWLLPPGERRVMKMTALTPTPLETIDLRITRTPTAGSGQKPSGGGDADGQAVKATQVSIYNGEIVNVMAPVPILDLKIRYAKPRPWQSDRTMLRFRLPDMSFGVAVEDVIKNGGVFVRDAGILVSRGDMNRDQQGYLASIRDKKTVLQRVREMPDQTFAQAIEHVHNEKQNLQPMLLSLACDNHKFVAHRDGTILFSNQPDQADLFRVHKLTYAAQMSPRYGQGKDQAITRRLESEWLPAPVTLVREGGITYRQRTYVVAESDEKSSSSPWLQPRPVCVVEYSVEGQPSPGQELPRLRLTFQADIEKKELAEVGPWEVTYKGNRLAALAGLDARLNLKAEKGAWTVTWPLGGGPVLRLFLYGYAVKGGGNGPASVAGDPFERFERYWRDLMATTLQIEVPDPLLNNVMKASQVHCLLAARNEADGQRISPWIASFTYGPLESESNSIVRGMDYWGHHEFSKRGLDFFVNKYSPTGMLTTGYTLMGTGWHLWSLGEHYRLTQDKDWVKANADKIASVCDWILRQRAKTMKELPTGRPPEYGLAPPGVMADWTAFAYYFCLNGYYYKGLHDAATALVGIGYPKAESMLKEAAGYREDILRAYHWAQARMPVYPLKDGTSVPGYPSQLTAPGPTNNFFPGEDGNRSWCYDVELGAHHLVPQEVLDARSREVGDMMDHMEDVQFLADGWFDYPAERNEKDWYNLGGFAKVQPYYCRNIEIYGLRDDVKPYIRSYFNTIPSLLGFETLSFQEHFAGVAAWNKTHETGYFLYYSRVMVVQERGDELWLAPFVTDQWLKDGQVIRVSNAPTQFGTAGFEIASHVADGRIEATVEWPTRQTPRRVALRLRHPEGKPIREVSAAGEGAGKAAVSKDDASVVYLEPAGPVSKLTVLY